VLVDKSILESKDLLSDNRSGSPNIHGLRNLGPHSKWCLARYNSVDRCLQTLQTFLRILNILVFNVGGTCQNPKQERLWPNSCNLRNEVQDHFFFDEAKKLENEFNSTHAS
jgi:hypothetical protein